MSNVQSDGLGIQVPRPKTSGEQLATPALTPISEHGLSGDQTEEQTLEFDEPWPQTNGSVESDASTKAAKAASVTPKTNGTMRSPRSAEVDKVLKLSPARIFELTTSPNSLPVRAASPIEEEIPLLSDTSTSPRRVLSNSSTLPALISNTIDGLSQGSMDGSDTSPSVPLSIRATPGAMSTARPSAGSRSSSTPMIKRKQSNTAPRNPIPSNDQPRSRRPSLTPLKVGDTQNLDANGALRSSPANQSLASPMPTVIPLPPLSLPTYLQLELSSERPSALYIHRPVSTEFPYESSKVKFERLLNFLFLPPQLEQVLWFGALACLDAWLYNFTILPLRFFKAVALLVQWWMQSLVKEAYDIGAFIYTGLGRFWRRQRRPSISVSRRNSTAETEQASSAVSADNASPSPTPIELRDPLSSTLQSRRSRKSSTLYRHRRAKSTPSALLPNHKADILHGLLIIISCLLLVRLDASKMYHSIRGQAAIKLYVIYNVLEVCDRLFSALGQDVLECLFSKETLERKENGRSKIIRPLWMFLLALVYNVIHAAALFYQVITLNVAVNSYSNALLTLLMSNQFVEIKGTVFKKFEKENLFQLTCADVVERFQLWLMLLIIAMRNIVEVGGLSISSLSSSSAPNLSSNTTGAPVQSSSILPQAFTLFPDWSGQVLGPFLIVLGSEMLVDWLKHAYINKFNSVSPAIYGRFLDVLAKDYYAHAFADQNLTKRLGLPVLPLSCLFIRAAVQTYHMFLATHMPLPIPSTATAIENMTEAADAGSSPATTAALQHIDLVFRRALGRSSFGAAPTSASNFLTGWSIDDIIALSTMLLFFFVLYLFLLAFKLVLGMALLSFSRSRYKGMKERERASYETQSRRVGGWGVVEVDEDKRRWVYEGDEEGLRHLREREARAREKAKGGGGAELKLDGVGRYMMAAKRIW